MMAIVCIVLYIPSATPPGRFLDVVRSEHALNERVWGPVVADRILARMLAMQSQTQQLSSSPAPSGSPLAHADPVAAAPAQQLSQASSRLFANAYFRSIDSLYVLVTYRLAALVETLPVLA